MNRYGSVLSFVVLVCSVLLSGCATHVYRDEAFSSDTPFSRRIAGAGELVCDSVKRALLNQGYVLEPGTEAETLTGSKAFQQDESMVTLRIRTSCMANPDGSRTVFASAVEEVNELQTVKQPTGVNIAGFGFTVPSGSTKIPMTVKRETVQDADFYARFYKHVEELIAKSRN